MSLATRCPACGTVFRVVQDQLRVSEGWVRCGHCQEVFNALESLFELGAEAPLPPAGSDATTPPRQAGAAPSSPPPAVSPPATPEVDLSDPGDGSAASPTTAPPPAWQAQPPAAAFEEPISVSGLLARSDIDTAAAPPASELEPESQARDWPGDPVQPTLLDAEPTPVPEAALEAVEDAASLPFEPDDEPAPSQAHDEAIAMPSSRLFDEEVEDARLSNPSTTADDEAVPSQFAPAQREWQRKRPRRPRAPDTEAGSSSFSRGQPGFVRQAERDAVWQRPAVRAALIGAAVLLAGLLLLQTLLLFRDGLAARWPSTRPWLTGLCGLADCQVRAPRALDRISLDGSKLTSGEAPDSAGAALGNGKALRFVAELHNAAPYSVLAPALEISFTDPLGQVVARRVLLPAELGLASGSIAPRSPWQVDARLDVGELSVAGFSVEIFYP